MGQRFLIVNHDKKEFVALWKDRGGNITDWCASGQAGIIAFLIARDDDGERNFRDELETSGRFAGDRVELVGEYDMSGDYDKITEGFTDISDKVKRNMIGCIGYDILQP